MLASSLGHIYINLTLGDYTGISYSISLDTNQNQVLTDAITQTVKDLECILFTRTDASTQTVKELECFLFTCTDASTQTVKELECFLFTCTDASTQTLKELE